MWRKATCAAGGLAVACAAAFITPSVLDGAGAASFEARWQAAAPGRKADRLPGPREAQRQSLFSFSVPTAQRTIIIKRTDGAGEAARMRPLEPRVVPARVPVQNGRKDKEKLPIGCEPSFSPVTMPSMANVSGRCLS